MARPLTLYQFKKHFHIFTRLMRDTGAYVDIAYGDRLVRLHMDDMGKAPKRIYRQRRSAIIDDKKIQAGLCPACSRVEVNGVCMNAVCSTGQPSDSVDGDG
jgi:hypothetical protein